MRKVKDSAKHVQKITTVRLDPLRPPPVLLATSLALTPDLLKTADQNLHLKTALLDITRTKKENAYTVRKVTTAKDHSIQSNVQSERLGQVMEAVRTDHAILVALGTLVEKRELNDAINVNQATTAQEDLQNQQPVR